MKNVFKVSLITAALLLSNSVFAADTSDNTTTNTHKKDVMTKDTHASASDAKITKNVKKWGENAYKVIDGNKIFLKNISH